MRFIASELILSHPEALASLRAADLRRLGKGMASWSDVDIFGCYLSGPAWRERQVPDSLIRGWARSRDHWWRRAALVSTVPLNVKARGGSGDTPRTQRQKPPACAHARRSVFRCQKTENRRRYRWCPWHE